jgi:CPA1 family monovalent cation:H+ antiporter
LLFLPPLVFRAAFFTSVRDFRALLQPILSLAVVLVLITTVVVAVVLHWLVPQVGWPIAFAFGAIVSPPDAVAAAAVFRGLGVPRRIVTLLEVESLINDATALVAYRAALAATAVAFSAGGASIQVVVVGAGGMLVGLGVGMFGVWLLRRLNDPPVEITLSLLTPFAAYLPAEGLGLSGILATVAAGLYLGPRSPYMWGSEERISARAVWDMLVFILNGLVFILIGLQLSAILPALAGRSMFSLIGLGLVLSLTVIVVRLAWVFLDVYLVKRLTRFVWSAWISFYRRAAQHASEPCEPQVAAARPHWRETLVVGWAGMRGVVSLAVVLSLPEGTPERSLLVFLTFFVILATLVGQGLSLPLVIRALGLAADNSITAQQDLHARRSATEAALLRIEQLRVEWPGHLPLLDALQAQYGHRVSHFGSAEDGTEGTDGNGASSADEEQELLEHHLIRRAVLGAERRAVLDLKESGEIEDTVWRQIERDLDLEELRMDA